MTEGNIGREEERGRAREGGGDRERERVKEWRE